MDKTQKTEKTGIAQEAQETQEMRQVQEKKRGRKLPGNGVLWAAALLGGISCFFVHPDRQYLTYIDYRVLGLLFSLMVVMAGFRQLGIFDKIGSAILKQVKTYRGFSLMMMALCFFSAMVITNDVALITFVPLTILVLTQAEKREKMIQVIVLETVAANLGSMLTPLGNPQNLYLYSVSGMSLSDFLYLMAPLTTVSFILLCVACLVQKNSKMQAPATEKEAATGEKGELFFFLGLFLLCLGTVFRLLPFQVPLTVAVIGTFVVRRQVLKAVDYQLLLTFAFFFLFIGNLGRVEEICALLEEMITGRELLFGFLSSQIISNVPACILLSGFTENWKALLMGVNIGGLGTLIASMASLISFQYYGKECTKKEQSQGKGTYLLVFTAVNLLFAVILLPLGLLLL